MAKLYAMNIAPYWASGQWRSLLIGLPEQRQRRALSCRHEQDSARSAGAGWLLRYALMQVGIPPEQQALGQNRWGKPHLLGRTEPQFSLSHSGDWVVCAVGDSPLGVDIELPRCTMQLARRFFHPKEIASLQALSPAVQLEFLSRLWVCKEAFVKALGLGLNRPLASFCVSIQEGGAYLEETGPTPPFRLHEYRLGDSYVCLCTVEERPELRFVEAGVPLRPLV